MDAPKPHPEAPPPVLPVSPAPPPLPPEASSELPEVEVAFVLTQQDLNDFQAHFNKIRSKKETPIAIASAIAIILLVTILQFFLKKNNIKFSTPVPYSWNFIFTMIPIIVLVTVFFLFFSWQQKKVTAKELENTFVIGLGKNFIHCRHNNGESKTRWNSIKAIVLTEKHLFFMLTKDTGQVIPRQAFASEEEVVAFFDKANTYWKASQNNFV
jgi:hypothetical protein